MWSASTGCGYTIPERDLPWHVGDSSELQISADKSSYAPGETAQLMIRTPLEGTAL
jgi:uncharacterized protein YfaS (alpha-2-macroglobulin family)